MRTIILLPKFVKLIHNEYKINIFVQNNKNKLKSFFFSDHKFENKDVNAQIKKNSNLKIVKIM